MNESDIIYYTFSLMRKYQRIKANQNFCPLYSNARILNKGISLCETL
jgi:hypothetical protein